MTHFHTPPLTPHQASQVVMGEITLFRSPQGHPVVRETARTQLALQVNTPWSNSFVITAISSLQMVISYPLVLL